MYEHPPARLLKLHGEVNLWFFFNLNCPTADKKDRLISKILKFNLIFVYIKSFEDRIIICIKVHFSQHPRLFSGVQAKWKLFNGAVKEFFISLSLSPFLSIFFWQRHAAGASHILFLLQLTRQRSSVIKMDIDFVEFIK